MIATVEQDRQLVDTIVYLALLASTNDGIDDMMDTLRIVTARWDSSKPLNETDRNALMGLQTDLKTYLIERDPLRDFTRESLEQRLRDRTAQQTGTSSLPNFFLLVLAPIVVACSMYLLPIGNVSFDVRTLIAIPIFLTAVSVEVIWLYFSSLRNFKPELRRVFDFQCLGVVFLCFALLVYVAIQLFGWARLPVFRYGGLPEGGVVSLLFFYLSLWLYAKLLNIKGWFRSIPTLLAVMGGAIIYGAVLPHAPNVGNELYFDFSAAGLFAMTALCVFSACTARAIVRTVTAAYARSMRILFWFFVVSGIGSLLFNIYLITTGEFTPSVISVALGLGAGPPMILMLYCSYSFKKETGK